MNNVGYPPFVFINVLVGLTLALAAGPVAAALARRLGLMDVPGILPHKQHSNPVPLAGGLTLAAVLLVGHAQHRDDERDVALDRGDHVAHVHPLLADQAQDAVARLGERGEVLEGLERRRETTSVPFVVAPRRRGVVGLGSSQRREGGGLGHGHDPFGE